MIDIHSHILPGIDDGPGDLEEALEMARLAVADGITTCDVGTGALASSMTIGVLESTFNSSCVQDHFAELITQASARGCQMMIDWAETNGQSDNLRGGLDLMGTTLNAGWLEGRFLSVANLGDSRAYLVTDDAIEQLTVDGDLGSGMLAAGTPPEQVRDLGGLSKALRQCVGGCQVTEEGKLIPLPDCRPILSHCPLLPGDVVILCSDGLVEEGAFLEPEALLDLVQRYKNLPPTDLAELLAQEADKVQRLPSAQEPEGFGDNISCIVVKVLEKKGR